MTAARWDLRPFVDELGVLLEEHALEGGHHARLSARTDVGRSRTPDAYGVADAVNILYTTASMPSSPSRRAELVAALQSFQDPATGMFHDPSHVPEHTTAHVSAALELLEARPAHPLRFLEPLRSPETITRFLDELDWDRPWPASHRGAGVGSAIVLAEDPSPVWVDAYLGWLDENVDPATGLWRAGRMLPLADDPGLFANLGGSFHYHFVYLALRRAMPHPERVIDTCLTLLADGGAPIAARTVGFAEIDWVYCLHRALRQCGHRRAESEAALAEVAGRVVALLTDPGYWRTPAFDDLHTVFGALCTVAELQLALPGRVLTPRPLRLVLDRRPFI
jgi:hypothetical protein